MCYSKRVMTVFTSALWRKSKEKVKKPGKSLSVDRGTLVKNPEKSKDSLFGGKVSVFCFESLDFKLFAEGKAKASNIITNGVFHPPPPPEIL